MDAFVAVRARIAAALFGQRQPVEAELRAITLKPHQVDAVQRLRSALQVHGGALLADAPGLGKTFVALAVARDAGGAVVAAPAALRAQWTLAANRAGVPIHWCSLEVLSRRLVISDHSLLIVDEAHHLRNAGTRRYAHAAELAVGKQVLLLTATPVHNRPSERDALLALFLGTQAAALDAGVMAQLIVRREADPLLLPARRPTRWLTVPSSPGVGVALRALPPPLPAADGRLAAALARLSLAHAWSSSLAALDASARRALLRSHALDDALAAGRWPTRRETLAWSAGEDSSQLAFAALVAAPAKESPLAARAVIAHHVSALLALRALTTRHLTADTTARAEVLRRLMEAHGGATILAFSRYAATVRALWRALRLAPGVVAITSTGVHSAGAGLRRSDVLTALASDGAGSAVAPLRLVLSTDLLGEGLDLRAASVVVHLDQPWTPALLDQREGRAARLSSPHASVAVYALRPPPGAARLLTLGARLRAKREAMHQAASPGDAREELLAFVRPWLSPHPVRFRPSARAIVAAARAGATGWVAAVRTVDGQLRVVASPGGGEAVAEDDARLLAMLQCVSGAAAVDPARERSARGAIRRWLAADSAARLADGGKAVSGARTAVARRLDAALRNVPLHQRAARQARITAVRRLLSRRRGAGVDRALAAAAQFERIEDVLDALERLGAAGSSATEHFGPARLLSLLLLAREQ